MACHSSIGTQRVRDWRHQLQEWVKVANREARVLRLAARDPRVPWPAKMLAIAVAAYALSPIDLIPDFIPVFGYLDDVILVPIGVYIVIRLIPGSVLDDLRQRASENLGEI
jgi:uncharacterized membrane protein YkvA (DUF1232 family)